MPALVVVEDVSEMCSVSADVSSVTGDAPRNGAGDKETDKRSYTRVLGDKAKRITEIDENMNHKYNGIRRRIRTTEKSTHQR